jgi:hypothetical protein
MKSCFETLDVSRCELVFLSSGGAVVGVQAFSDLDDLKSWLGYWKIALFADDTSIRAMHAHRYSILRDHADHAGEDGSMRLNVIIAGCCLSPEEALALSERSAAERQAIFSRRARGYSFRNGSVPGIGKLGSYRYFRRGMRTFGTHREAAEVCDDDEFRHCSPSP